MDRNTIQVEWVIIQYPAKSDKGKRTLEIAKRGGGTLRLLNRDRQPSDPIVIAFLRPVGKLLEGMVKATPAQAEKLDKTLG